MHGLEWEFSIILAAVLIITGVNRAFRHQKARDLFPWVKEAPRALVQAIGIVEILGALGLILPAAATVRGWILIYLVAILTGPETATGLMDVEFALNYPH